MWGGGGGWGAGGGCGVVLVVCVCVWGGGGLSSLSTLYTPRLGDDQGVVCTYVGR